jgi:transcriptional regulator with GAF, ATPase, and Fis domain
MVERAAEKSRCRREREDRHGTSKRWAKSVSKSLKPVANKLNFSKAVDEFQYHLILHALKENGYNQAKTARDLGMRRFTLYYYMDKLKIPVKRLKRGKPKKVK